MDENKRDTERTTIVTTDGDGRGSTGIILVVALIAIVLAVLFFAGVFDRDDEPELNVTVNSPDVNVIVPETQLPPLTVPEIQPLPDVNVNVTTPPPEPEGNLSNTGTAITNSG